MPKKKIVFFLVDLNLGGIETSFINKLNKLDLSKLDITVVLEHKRGVFLDKIPNNIKVIDYNLSECKYVLLRKIINRSKLIFNCLKNYHKYDIAVNECNYDDCLTRLALKYGKESILWIHNNYFEKWNSLECQKYFKEKKYDKYNKLIFVSQRAYEDYQNNIKPIPNQELIMCYNLIPEVKKQNKKVIIKPAGKFIFLNVGRQVEEQKQISRLIAATKILKEKYDNFEVWLVGDGSDIPYYEELIKKYNLEKVIKMQGFQKDPGPFYEVSDAVIMTSDYEGFPVVYCECMYFQKHLITTDVSDAKYIFDRSEVTITKKDPQDIAEKMAYILNNKINVKKFPMEEFNQNILKNYQDIFYKEKEK